MMEKAIIANNITKKYKLYDSTKERLLDLIAPRDYGEDFYALTDVSFEAEKGDAIGFIGVNGSGKSTLSNIIAGIVPETSGELIVNGETSLIAVSAGLNGELSGRDNIELKCLMLGFSKNEIKELEPEIIEFSELGKFIDQPVKSYSSGMRSRLGFAISVSVDPDIIIIDEALSVGDRAFATKSLEKMKEFKEAGKTMIFVSHSIGQMKQFCEKILWLEYGMVKEFGPVDEVIPNYERFIKKWRKMPRQEREQYRDVVTGFQHKILENPDYTQTYAEWLKANSLLYIDNYEESSTSRLGQIKDRNSYIYRSPKTEKDKKSSEDFKAQTYFIKKQAIYHNDLYYLLSNKPSAKVGIIGWIKASDVYSHSHIAIDDDPKLLHLKGTGCGYNRPWGGRKNLVLSDLRPFKNCEFKINKTEKVGENIWYRGMLAGKQTWIHSTCLYKKHHE